MDYLVRCLPSRPNHLRNIVIKKLKSATLIFFCIFLGNINVEAQNAYSFFVAITSRKQLAWGLGLGDGEALGNGLGHSRWAAGLPGWRVR